MSTANWGKKKYDEGSQFKKTGKPKEGNNFIRILPGLGDDAPLEVYRTTHWGYAGNHPTDATKTLVRPFRCIEESKMVQGQRMTTQPCPECENYNAKFAEAAAYKAKLEATKNPDGTPKYNKETLKTAMKSRNDWLQAHRPERKWYINVKYKDGTFGDYKINHKIHRAGIKLKLKELAETYQIDGLAPDQGVWFNVKRPGDGVDPPDVIEFEMELVDAEVNGRKQKVPNIVLAPLSEEDWDKAVKECRDLTQLGGQVLTYAQIESLVKCSGEPDVVDSIFGDRPKAAAKPASKSAPAPEPEEAVEPEDAAEAANMSKAINDVGQALGKLVDTVKDTVAKPQPDPERLARIRAKKEAEEKAAKEAAEKAAKAAAAAAAPPVNTDEMTDEEYMKYFDDQEKAAKEATT